jgi:ankyrin repeat protein
MLASKSGDINIVTYILNKSSLATLNNINNEGYTALLLAAENGHHLICGLLISKNALITTVNNYNINMLAAKNGHNDVLTITSTYVNINIVNSNKESALTLAAKNNEVYTVIHIIKNLNGSTDYLTGYEKFDKVTAAFLYVKNI